MAEAIIAAGGKAVVVSNGGPMERLLARCGAASSSASQCEESAAMGFYPASAWYDLRDEGAEIVHVRSRVPAWIALPIAKRMDLITVSTVHGRFHTSSALKRIYNGKMLKADHVIAISNYIKSRWITRAYFGVEERLSVIHRGVDTTVFDAGEVPVRSRGSSVLSMKSPCPRICRW